jgi:GDP-L-fucose synthase
MELKNKKILITGAGGFLGQHLVKNLIEKRGVLRENLFLPSFADLDLRLWENCQKAVSGMDIVVHLAAHVGGIGLNQKIPGELFYDNAIMGIQLIEAARQADVSKMVNLGTVCMYPKFAPVPFKEDDLWNGYPEETNAAYGLAKKSLLVQSQAYRQQYGFNAIVLMPVNLYGPGDNFDPDFSHVMAALIKKVYEAKQSKKDYVEVWGSGAATREFLYVGDAAEGIALAMEKYDKPDPVNLGSGLEISIKDLVLLICRLANFEGEIRWDTNKPDGQPKRRLDTSRALKEFGFQATMPLEEGLKRTIDWYLSAKL